MIEIKGTINKLIKILKQNKWIHYFIIIAIGIVLSIPLNQIQIRETHDGALHFLRVLGTIDTLKIGKFPPLINQYYCNASGYAINLFYPPIVTYIPLLIKLFTPTYSMALKIYGAICIILSGITMYQFTYQLTKKRGIALFAAIFYLIAPYKLANVYKRFAIGEFTAMVFMPLVFLGLTNLFEADKKKHYYIAIGTIGLMLSHTVTTLYTAIFCVIYILFHLKQLKNQEIIKKCFINGIFILLVSMLFWLPLLEATLLADYAIMDDSIIATNADYVAEHTILFSQLFKDIGEENGTTFLLGIPTILAILLTPFMLKKVDIKYKDFYLLSIIFGLFSIFMISKFFPWRIMPNILCKLQYPWRMEGFFNFFSSFVCGVNLFLLLQQLKRKDILKICLILIIVIVAVYNSLDIMSQFYAKDKEKDKKYETYILENKQISHFHINRDYMPLKAIKLQNTYVKEREDKTYVLEGSTKILDENKINLKDEMKLKKVQEGTLLEFPYYYYPGYKITLVVNGIEKEIKTIESEHGYLACCLDEEIEEGALTVEYVGTTITYVSYAISAISFVVFIVYIVIEKNKNSTLHDNKDKY